MTRLNINGETDRQMDRISELPEPLIHHIFSFLPIKSVVSTSVLSTKWRYYWTSNPIIEFRESRSPNLPVDRYVEVTNRFMNFVDRVLSNRQDVHSPPIKKFRLQFNNFFDKTKVNQWISTALRHKVEEITLLDHQGIVFPPSLFTCETLTMLEIKKVSLELPESVNFPNLKILRLASILKDEHLIQKLLSNSPILEEFSLDVLIFIKHMCICGPNLKRLFIKAPLCKNCNIQINAPKLQSFRYSSVLPNDFVLHNFSTLVDADIVLSSSAAADSRERGGLGLLATKLFNSLSNVKRLTVSEYSLKLLSYQGHFETNLPLFCSLTQLEVTSANFYFGYEFLDEVNLPCWIVGILLDFLHNSPNLESLVFAEGFCRSNDYGWSLDLVPSCLLLRLKSIDFRGLYWGLFDRNLVRWFLKNAKVLQRVRITISSQSSFLSMNSNYRKEVLDEISFFPRGSPECVLHVS